MKYLSYSELENINNQLGSIDTGDVRVFGRIEGYSCKSCSDFGTDTLYEGKHTRDDLKLKHFIEHKYEDGENAIKSPKSPFGPLSSTTSRKTFLYLLATLNAVYPDYDFSDIKPELFSKVPALGLVVNNVANSMLVHFGNSKRSVEEGIWSAIDRVINTKMCDIYTFIPPAELEPDAEEGNLWSFFYFFYNKPDKRIVFFTARGVSLLAPIQSEERGDYLSEEPFSASMSHTSLSYEDYTMETIEL